jgi:hypothetical protein
MPFAKSVKAIEPRAVVDSRASAQPNPPLTVHQGYNDDPLGFDWGADV